MIKGGFAILEILGLIFGEFSEWVGEPTLTGFYVDFKG